MNPAAPQLLRASGSSSALAQEGGSPGTLPLASAEAASEAARAAAISGRLRGPGFRIRAPGLDPLAVLAPLLLAAAWEIAARRGALDRTLFSSPSDILAEIAASARTGLLWIHVRATLTRVLWGFLAGSAAATVLGVATGYFALLRKLLDPVLQSVRSIPSLAWVPLFILWLGIGEAPKVTLIALGSFFPVYLSLTSGIRGMDRKLVEAGLACRKRGWRLVREVYLPATFPAYHVGLRSGLGLGWMFVVAAEIMGASRGVGYLLVDGQATGRPAIMIASVLLFALLGKATDTLLVLGAAPWLRWQDTFERQT